MMKIEDIKNTIYIYWNKISFSDFKYDVIFWKKKRVLRKERNRVLKVVKNSELDLLRNNFSENVLKSIKFIDEDPEDEMPEYINANCKVKLDFCLIDNKEDLISALTKDILRDLVLYLYQERFKILDCYEEPYEYPGERIALYNFVSYSLPFFLILKPKNKFFDFIKL